MKKIGFIFALLISCMASAQNPVDRRPFEAEIGVLGSYGLNNFAPISGFYLAARYNYATLPVDLGVEYSNVGYSNKKDDNYYKNENLCVVSNYNFYELKNFTPFVGMGAGYAWNEFQDEYYDGGIVGHTKGESLSFLQG